jgi:GT2 family glycosyltransferase
MTDAKTPAPDAPRVAIIILTYNGVADTLACLRSLAALSYPQCAVELVVVDNASRDGTPAQVRAAFPTVRVIENGANLGFAAGNNVGLRYALAQGFDYVLLLNNDTEVAPDFLTALVAACEAAPRVGAAGPMICYAERPDLIWSAGGIINRRRGTTSMRGIGEPERGQFAQVTTVDFATGCALLLRRAALERAGLLDERFFMYYEETEWCVRAARAGFHTVHVPHARIWHKIPVVDRVDRPYVAYYMTRNRLLFLRATHAGAQAWINVLMLQDLRTCLSYSIRPKWRHRAAQRRAMLLGLRDYVLGRFGGASYRWV